MVGALLGMFVIGYSLCAYARVSGCARGTFLHVCCSVIVVEIDSEFDELGSSIDGEIGREIDRDIAYEVGLDFDTDIEGGVDSEIDGEIDYDIGIQIDSEVGSEIDSDMDRIGGGG